MPAGGHEAVHLQFEPPSPQTATGTDGFSTYGHGASASASSALGFSETEEEENRYIGIRGDETEVEREGARSVTPTPPVMERKISPPSALGSSSRLANRRSMPQHPSMPLRRSVLPLWIGLPLPSSDSAVGGDRKGKGRAVPRGFYLTRRTCEDGLLLGGVASGVWQLGRTWSELAVAGEIMLLLGLSVVYMTVRGRSPAPALPPAVRSPTTVTFARPGSPASLPGASMRERGARASHSLGPHHHAVIRDDLRRTSPLGAVTDEPGLMIGAKGAVWGTEGREYRDCPDDGALFALLLAPLVASGLLDAALTQLAAQPDSPLPAGWNIEPPLVLPSTPLRALPGKTPELTEAIKALSALATSRRNLVQLFTLCSFVLLVHLARTLHLETRQAKIQMRDSIGAGTAPGMERENSGSGSGSALGLGGTYWLKRGEWRRTKSVVGFAFLVTLCCLGVKIVTAQIGRGVWSDMSPSDIVIATLFYQFSLYVCIRLARRGFTLGELAVVCNAATALFMETVNMTRMKIRLLRTPYIKTYRLPTPLLTFQLALIPGSLLAGFLLSPLLYLSRHLAQRPAHRLRFPHEKPVHRRLLALGFYAGSALVCGGIVGVWTRWCLGWRDPFVWVAMFVLEGQHWYTRPALLAYWGLLAVISVAGWSRQLVRARRHRRYDPPAQPTRAERQNQLVAATAASSTKINGMQPTSLSAQAVGNGPGNNDTNSSGFATMMDAADQRLPTFSVNARRKFFHALAVVMFVPGIAIDPAFTHLSFSVAFALFNFAEYVRYFALWPFGVSVHLFLNEFLDSKDSGTAILSHFYLLAGCASPLWLEGHRDVLSHFGVLSLGIGDALASIIGRRFGRTRWSQTGGKTVEGSIAFFFSVLLSTGILRAFGVVGPFNFWPYALTTALAAVLEAMSDQNDNLILPMFGWAVGTLLGV